MPRNTSGLKRDAGPGRPKGRHNTVPTSFKRSLAGAFEQLEHEQPDLFKAALEAGLKAKPPRSFQYLQLWAHYRLGKPADTINVHASDATPWVVVLSSPGTSNDTPT